MTAHIVTTLLTLLLFLGSLLWLNRAKEPKATVPWLLTSAIAFLLLPTSYHPAVPLTHFVFEATSDNLLWFKVVFSMLWLLSGVLLWRYATKSRQLIATFAHSTIYFILGFWGYLALSLSGYEPPGPTPAITAAPVYLAQWGSTQLVVLCLLFLLILRAEYKQSSWPAIAIGLIIFSYLLVAFLPLLQTSAA